MTKKFFRDHPVHKSIVPYLDKLFILRPTLFFPVWVMVTAGMTSSVMNISRYQVWLSDFNLFTICLFVGITLVSGSTFIINQIQDVDSDDMNEKLFLVGKKVFIEDAVKIQKFTLLTGAVFLLISGYLNLIMGAFLYLFWGYLYNIEPFHWKKKPILGMLANTLAGFVLYSTGWIHAAVSSDIAFMQIGWSNMILISIPYLLCYTAVSLLTTIPDVKGDEPTGAITFPLKFGVRLTIALSAVMVLIAFRLGWIHDDPVSTTAAMISLPFYIVALLRNKVKDVLRAIRYSIFILAFLLFTVYPLLLPAVLVVFYLSKYYYWHRFNLHYPTFLVDEEDD